MQDSNVERVAMTAAKLGISKFTLNLNTGQRAITRNDGDVVDDCELIVVTPDVTMVALKVSESSNAPTFRFQHR